jgi:hypothetical protein
VSVNRMLKKNNVITKDVVWPSFQLDTINQEGRARYLSDTSARTACVRSWGTVSCHSPESLRFIERHVIARRQRGLSGAVRCCWPVTRRVPSALMQYVDRVYYGAQIQFSVWSFMFVWKVIKGYISAKRKTLRFHYQNQSVKTVSGNIRYVL